MRRIVATLVEDYSRAITKDDKSRIVARVLEQVRAHGAGFVKQADTSSWYDVGDVHAREKISQAFRDLLHDQYKSSLDARRKLRQAKRKETMEDTSSSTRTEASDFESNNKLTDEDGNHDVEVMDDKHFSLDAPLALNPDDAATAANNDNKEQDNAADHSQRFPRLSLILSFDEDFREFSEE